MRLPFRVGLSLSLSWALSAEAQMTTDERRATARAAYAEGVDLEERGDCRGALRRFEAAQELYDAPTHLLHLARCQAALGRLATAAETYEVLQRKALAPDAPAAFVEARAEGREALDALRPRVPKLVVRTTPADVDGLELLVDGKTVPGYVTGLARPVNPGRYTVSAKAPSYRAADLVVDVHEGDTKTLELALTRLEAPAPAATWTAALGAGTDFPVAIGVHAHVEAPMRLRLSTSLGLLPVPYVGAINAFVVAVGGYDDNTADLVRSALKSSLIWRTHAGYRPFSRLGLYFEGGYGLVALGGSATGPELVEGLTGRTIPANATRGGTARSYDVASVLHMLDVEVGYEVTLAPHVQLRLALGGAFTIASATNIEPRFTPTAVGQRAVDELTAYGERYLDDTFTSYVFTPVVSTGLAYVF